MVEVNSSCGPNVSGHCRAKARVWTQLNMFKAFGNLLLTVLRRHFCCASFMLHVVMSVCIWSSAILSPELQLPIMLPVSFCLVI